MATRRNVDAWRVIAPELPPSLVQAFPSFIDPKDTAARRRRRREFATRTEALAPPGPAHIDWRTSGAVPPPRSQEQCNTCTSFAIVSSVESLNFIKNGNRIDLAPGFIHTCLCASTCAKGVAPEDALDVVTKSGIAFAFAGDYPFPPAQCSIGNRFRVTGRTALPDPNAAMHALATGPVVGDMFIDPAFVRLAPGAIYKFTDEDNRRLHTVSVVGYDRDRGCWIISNSYGTGWCDGGFGLVAFGSGGLLADRGGWQIAI